jgi:riboflavin biosynthesis pyrimidine reductase
VLAQVTTTEGAKRQAEKKHMFQSILEAIRDEVSELKVLSDLTLGKAELLVEGGLVVIVLHLA